MRYQLSLQTTVGSYLWVLMVWWGWMDVYTSFDAHGMWRSHCGVTGKTVYDIENLREVNSQSCPSNLGAGYVCVYACSRSSALIHGYSSWLFLDDTTCLLLGRFFEFLLTRGIRLPEVIYSAASLEGISWSVCSQHRAGNMRIKSCLL